MVSEFGVLLAMVLVSTTSPSRGDVWREIYTKTAAFEAADLNHDGRISEFEYEAYFAERRTKGSGGTNRLTVPGNDANSDGAFTPDELYDEARRFDEDNGSGSGTDRDDNYYGDPYSE
ncbi:MAG: hypothetical protein ACWA5T_02525 [Parvularcula sp.]